MTCAESKDHGEMERINRAAARLATAALALFPGEQLLARLALRRGAELLEVPPAAESTAKKRCGRNWPRRLT